MVSSEPYSRDFRGYGPNLPNPHWSNQARVAISFVLNVEEGAELSIAAGDRRNEGVYEIVLETQNVPDVAMASHFEYATRVGFWRVLKLFDDFGIPATINACGRAIEQSPWLAQEAIRRGHEICCHGYRWESMVYMNADQARETIAKTVRAIEQACGVTSDLVCSCVSAPSLSQSTTVLAQL